MEEDGEEFEGLEERRVPQHGDRRQIARECHDEEGLLQVAALHRGTLEHFHFRQVGARHGWRRVPAPRLILPASAIDGT